MNVIYFSLYINREEDSKPRLMQLDYALSTLEPYFNDSFSVIVYIDAKAEDYFYLMNKYPWLYLKRFKYNSEECLHHYAFHKWWNLVEVGSLNYNNILYLDNDVYFTRSPEYIFSKYTDDCVYTLFDKLSNAESPLLTDANNTPIIKNGKVYDFEDLLGFKGINSGQMLFKKEHIDIIKGSMTASLSKNYKEIVSLVDSMIEDRQLHSGCHRIVAWVGEQYAGQKTLLDLGLKFAEVDRADMDVVYDSTKLNSTIVHYIASVNTEIPIPNEFQERYA